MARVGPRELDWQGQFHPWWTHRSETASIPDVQHVPDRSRSHRHRSQSSPRRSRSRRRTRKETEGVASKRCSIWNTNCFEKPLRKLFSAFGGALGSFPVAFIVIPLFLSAAFGPGLLKIQTVTDLEYLYTPINGPAKSERDVINQAFPFNDSGQFTTLRRPHLDGILILILESKTDNILTKEYMQEIFDIDRRIREVTVANHSIVYKDICSSWNRKCFDNSILEIFARNASMVESTLLQYPQHGPYFLHDNLGGVLPLSENSNVLVQSAKAIKLVYNVKSIEAHDKEISNQWLSESIKMLRTQLSNRLNIHLFSTISMEQELEEATASVIPLFSITYAILITFAIASCMIFGDWVSSKPWLAMTGVIAAGLSILSAFGLMCWLNVEFASQVATMPFLALGIGIDDMFVMLSAWRRTNVYDTVKDRMRKTMEEAGVSITITSLTNTLAFGIGAITVFRSVHIFCLYTGVSMLFCYLYSITFFAGFMTVFGWREEQNRHCLSWCIECAPRDARGHQEKSLLHKLCCTGGFTRRGHEHNSSSKYIGAAHQTTPHPAMAFFKNYYGRFLMQNWTRAVAFILYLGYLAVAIYGCTQVREGLELSNLAPTNSYLVSYYVAIDKYFQKYGPYVNVVINDESLDYTRQETQDKIQSWIEKFERDDYFVNGSAVNWVNSYHLFRSSTSTPRPSNMTSLINSLNTVFFTIPGFDTFSNDVNIEGSNIKSSRFFVLLRGLTASSELRYMMERAREIAGDLGLTVFHPGFIFYDQYQVILPNTLQNMGIAVGCMIVVSIIMVPYMICSLYIGLSIASIITGVVGYMTLWGVNLDSISMINLILCIGFSVDYTAHITYSFVGAKGSSRKERVINALYELGFPVLQGAMSTTLGVVILFTSSAYIFQAFAKIILLVITFGAIHGLVVLPVVLSVIGPA